MSCANTAFLLFFTTALTVNGIAAEPAAALADPGERPTIFAVPPAPAIVPALPRAMSPETAAKLAATMSKFAAVPLPSESPSVVATATEAMDNIAPRNTIIRLPEYVVRDAKVPAFKERELLTPSAQLEVALKRHPGLRFGSFWIFRNDGLALAMFAEEERLEQKQEFEDLVNLTRVGDPATHATVKNAVERAFMREPGPGR